MMPAIRRLLLCFAGLPFGFVLISCTAQRHEDVDESPITSASDDVAAELADRHCWLVDTPVPVSDIHLVVRTVNTAAWTYPRYPIRLWGIAEEFKRDWATPSEIIGVQEVQGRVTGCLSGPSEAHGIDCFARVMAEHGLGATLSVRTTARGSNHNGIVIGGSWDLLFGYGDELGRDHWTKRPRRSWLTPPLTRRLLEASVRHKEQGWVLRFYTTHLSPGPGQKQQRLEQIDKLIAIVTSRVADGELPPIVTGDFNFRTGEAESYNKMSRHFQQMNELAVGCLPNGYPAGAGRDQIWVGRASAFPQTRGSLIPLRYHTTAARGGGIDLKSPRLVGPLKGRRAYTGPLSDHHSPALSFTIVDVVPHTDPGASVD